MKKLVKGIAQTVGVEISKAKKGRFDNEWVFEQQYDVLIDIGASVGKFSQPFLGKVDLIYCFEPIPNSFAQLKHSLGGYDYVELHNVAIGDDIGEVEFNLSSHHTSSSVLKMANTHKEAFPHSAKEEILKVKIEKLDNLIDLEKLKGKKVLTKIDVQGYEYFVLQGGSQVIASSNVVICEASFVELYQGQKLFDTIYKQFVQLGFEYKGNLSQIYNPKTGRVLQANCIFER